MVVRVKVRIRGGSEPIETSVLVNSGFEAEEPQLILPLSLAENAGLTLAEAFIEDFSTAGGGRVSGYRLERPVRVELILEDRQPVEAEAFITILPGEVEAIASDRLTSELGIVILDPWKGYWCLRDEVGVKLRESAPLKEWRQ